MERQRQRIEFDMARRKVLRLGGDVREHPRYSIEEAARYLRIPLTTMKDWVSGYKRKNRAGRIRQYPPVIQPADVTLNLLSFYNLAEAHILRATRDRDVPLENVRRAIEYIRQQFAGPHPLLSHEFETSGPDVFVSHLGQTINATRHGQLAMRTLLEAYLHRIERDKFGMPTQFSPMKSEHIAINPKLSSGKPVVKGTGIMVAVLASRKESGETVPELAQDFGLQSTDIEQAIAEYAM